MTSTRCGGGRSTRGTYATGWSAPGGGRASARRAAARALTRGRPLGDDAPVSGAQGIVAGGAHAPADVRGLTRRALLALGAGAATAVALRTWPGDAPLAAPRADGGRPRTRAARPGPPSPTAASPRPRARARRARRGTRPTPLPPPSPAATTPSASVFRDARRRQPGPAPARASSDLEHARLGAFHLFLTPGRRRPPLADARGHDRPPHGPLMADWFLGEVRPMAITFVPVGWAPCDAGAA